MATACPISYPTPWDGIVTSATTAGTGDPVKKSWIPSRSQKVTVRLPEKSHVSLVDLDLLLEALLGTHGGDLGVGDEGGQNATIGLQLLDDAPVEVNVLAAAADGAAKVDCARHDFQDHLSEKQRWKRCDLSEEILLYEYNAKFVLFQRKNT